MVKYLKDLRRIGDPVVEDGTTAFAMALARQDLDLIRILLDSNHPSEIDPKQLAKRAILELDRDPSKGSPALLKELMNGLSMMEKGNVQKRRLLSKWIEKDDSVLSEE